MTFGKFDDNFIRRAVLNVEHEENADLLLADSALFDVEAAVVTAHGEALWMSALLKRVGVPTRRSRA